MTPSKNPSAQPLEQENALPTLSSNPSSNKRPRTERTVLQVNSVAEREIQNLDLPPVEEIYYEAICTRKRKDEGKHVVLESVRVMKKIPGAASREDAEAGGYLTSRNGSHERPNDEISQIATWPDHTERSFQKHLRRILPMGKNKVKAIVRSSKEEGGSKCDAKRSEKKKGNKDKKRRTQAGKDRNQIPGELIEKMSGRNELIALMIERETGVVYSRKQVSSHLQVLRGKMSRPMDKLFTDSNGEPANQDEIAVIYQEWKEKYGALRFNEVDGVLEPLKSKKEVPDKLELRQLVPPTPLALLLPSNRSSQPCGRQSAFQFIEVQCGVYATPERSSKRIIHHYTSTLNSSAADIVGLTKIPDPSTFFPNLCLATTHGFAEQIILCEASLTLNSDIAQPGRYVGVTMVASIYCEIEWPEWWVTGAGYLSYGQKVVSEERQCRVSQLGTGSFSLSLHVSTCFLTMLLTDCARAESKISRDDTSPEATAARRASIRPILEAASYVQELYVSSTGECKPRRVAVFLWKFCEAPEGTTASWIWKQVLYGQDRAESTSLRAELQEDLSRQPVMKRPMWKSEQDHIGISAPAISRKPPLKSPLARGFRHRPRAPWPRFPSKRLEIATVSEHLAFADKDIQVMSSSSPFNLNEPLTPAETSLSTTGHKVISPLEFIRQYPGQRRLGLGIGQAPGLETDNNSWMNTCQMMDNHQDNGSLAIGSELIDMHQATSFPPMARRGISATPLRKSYSYSGGNDPALPFDNNPFPSVSVDDHFKVSSDRFDPMDNESHLFAPVSPSRVIHSSPEEQKKYPLEPPCPSPFHPCDDRLGSAGNFPDETASYAYSSTNEGSATASDQPIRESRSLREGSNEPVNELLIGMTQSPESTKAETFEVLDFSQQDLDDILREYDLLPTNFCSTIANSYLDGSSLDTCSLPLPADGSNLSYELDSKDDGINALPPAGAVDAELPDIDHDARHSIAGEEHELEKVVGQNPQLDHRPQQQPVIMPDPISTSQETDGKESGRSELLDQTHCELSGTNDDAPLFKTMPENWERLIAYVAGPQEILVHQNDEDDPGLEPYQSQEWAEIDTYDNNAAARPTTQGMVLGEIGEDDFDQYTVDGGAEKPAAKKPSDLS